MRRRLPSLLNGDTTRDVLAASLEPYLPVPVMYLALKETANETANTAGHRGAQLAVREMRYVLGIFQIPPPCVPILVPEGRITSADCPPVITQATLREIDTFFYLS